MSTTSTFVALKLTYGDCVALYMQIICKYPNKMADDITAVTTSPKVIYFWT